MIYIYIYIYPYAHLRKTPHYLRKTRVDIWEPGVRLWNPRNAATCEEGIFISFHMKEHVYIIVGYLRRSNCLSSTIIVLCCKPSMSVYFSGLSLFQRTIILLFIFYVMRLAQDCSCPRNLYR